MSTDSLDRVQPAHVGQGTMIEQSRAIEEVRAAIIVAQQMPRDEVRAAAAMRRSCGRPALAERAFYAYPRGRDQNGKPNIITGPSVYLARELARCWGNISHGAAELRRDDSEGFSEMQAFAWDLETNTRASQVFVVPHKRDTRSGVKPLVDMRDIYENNANVGARRLRSAIFAVLPQWYTDEAVDLCNTTIQGNGTDLEERIEVAVRAFARLDITLDQLEQKIGYPRSAWTAQDYARLDVLHASLKRNEISREEAFPPPRVTSADITGDPEGDA